MADRDPIDDIIAEAEAAHRAMPPDPSPEFQDSSWSAASTTPTYRRPHSKRTPLATGFLASVAIAIGSVAVISMFRSGSHDERVDFESVAQTLISRHLKAPATASFAPPADWVFERVGSDGMRMRAWVDSQNSFGALLRDSFVAIVHGSPKDDWRLSYLKFQGADDEFGSYELTHDEQIEHDTRVASETKAKIAESRRRDAERAEAEEEKRNLELKRKADEAGAFKKMHEQLDDVRKRSEEQDEQRRIAGEQFRRDVKARADATAAERQKIEDAKYHSWTDASGAEICEGKILSLASKTLTVELKSGEKMKLDLDTVSEADQKFVAAWRRSH
ncbi:MAG TPA: hypothetical protein VHU84_07910 [Lacipirellulaceae bacterium]|jgi:hypothetical protein|nr:hypothetical protein [Lacipirellulaceae bacterium]